MDVDYLMGFDLTYRILELKIVAVKLLDLSGCIFLVIDLVEIKRKIKRTVFEREKRKQTAKMENSKEFKMLMAEAFAAKEDGNNQLRTCQKCYCLIGIADPVLNRKLRHWCRRFGFCSMKRESFPMKMNGLFERMENMVIKHYDYFQLIVLEGECWF